MNAIGGCSGHRCSHRREDMVHQDLCDICGQPATHFFGEVTCFADGRPPCSDTNAKFCEVHAAAHEEVKARETLDSLLQSWRALATFAQPSDLMEIVFDAPSETEAGGFAGELMRACGGDAGTVEWADTW